MTTDQLSFMQQFKQGEMSVAKATQVLVEMSISPHVYTVLAGILMRFKTMEDGRRQIVNYVFPGDLLGIQGAMQEPLTHGVEALTEATLCVFSRDRMLELFREQPQLGFDTTWLSAKEEAALDEHLLALGQRTARERVAYLASFLFMRGKDTGLTRGHTLKISLTQTQIADTLGLSLVHTNRTIQAFRRSGLLVWSQNELMIADIDGVMDLAKYEHMSFRPRPFI
ncbi:MAG: Crp/Fnr family transcriptional regulator [Novosphingobium sp.]